MLEIGIPNRLREEYEPRKVEFGAAAVGNSHCEDVAAAAAAAAAVAAVWHV